MTPHEITHLVNIWRVIATLDRMIDFRHPQRGQFQALFEEQCKVHGLDATSVMRVLTALRDAGNIQ